MQMPQSNLGSSSSARGSTLGRVVVDGPASSRSRSEGWTTRNLLGGTVAGFLPGLLVESWKLLLEERYFIMESRLIHRLHHLSFVEEGVVPAVAMLLFLYDSEDDRGLMSGVGKHGLSCRDDIFFAGTGNGPRRRLCGSPCFQTEGYRFTATNGLLPTAS